ncbi:MAG: hypothetical protein V4617_01730 [Gemmatimonadota bacterium]
MAALGRNKESGGLDALRAQALVRAGFPTLGAAASAAPIRAARALVAAARGNLSAAAVAALAPGLDPATTPAAPLHTLGLAPAAVAALGSAGVVTVADLAALGDEVEAALLAAARDNGFSERPSAPAELIPTAIGAVASTVRFASFVRERELTSLTLLVDDDCVEPLPLSGTLKQPGNLGEIFTRVRCPQVGLGYLVDHRQRWINLGSHLGEVTHSLSLAPGEQRQLAYVTWRRTQRTRADESAEAQEAVAAQFVQTRALEEVTSATAREQASGGSQTEANSAATAAGVVGAVAIGAGLGATIGTVAVPGVGTVVGGLIGAGVSGVLAAGLVTTAAGASGTIESDTDGDRRIVARLNQRIALSTSQNASAVRSLWSTAVVEDTQGETARASTSNVTNYNHMHALNVQYYELLQHYMTRVDVERVEPLLFVPITALDFTGHRFIRDYWHAVRPLLPAALQEPGDAYFVDDSVPDAAPAPRNVPPALVLTPSRLEGLRIRLAFVSDGAVQITLAVGLDAAREVVGEEEFPRTAGDVSFRIFRFPRIDDARTIERLVLRVDGHSQRFSISALVLDGRYTLGAEARDLDDTAIGTEPIQAGQRRHFLPWTMPRLADPGPTPAEVRERAIDIARTRARNEAEANAHARLVANEARFLAELRAEVLRRRHAFTRAILAAIEPEEVLALMRAVRFGHRDAPTEPGVPLSLIADPSPVAVTPGALVFRLRRLDSATRTAIAGRLRFARELPDRVALLGYADELLTHFANPAVREAAAVTDQLFLPTGGMFAEAVLGRSNAAEYLDLERYFQWTDSPIPHQPPPIASASTDSRFQRGTADADVPGATLTPAAPVAFPDPVTASGTLAALAQAGLFRDLSGRAELAQIVGSVAGLAGQLGEAAASMTGAAADRALATAGQLSQTAMTLAQGAAAPAGSPVSQTRMGAAVNGQRALDAQATAAADPGSGVTPPSPEAQQLVRAAAGLPPAPPSTSRSVTVTARFLSIHGAPITRATMDTVFKLLSIRVGTATNLFAHGDPDFAANGTLQLTPVAGDAYEALVTGVVDGGAQVGAHVETGGRTFEVARPFATLPDRLEVALRFEGRSVRITRSSAEPRSEAIADATAQALGIDAQETGALLAVVNAGAPADPPVDALASATSVTEDVIVPTGALLVEVVPGA